MCNGYHYSPRALRRLAAKLEVSPIVEEAADVWPTKPAPVVTRRGDVPAAFEMLRWGLQPNWQKQLLLFARAETVHSKVTFSGAFLRRRCLVAASSFWEGACFGRADGGPLVIGGIWDSWMNATGDRQEGFVMLSTAAAEPVKRFNDRQPFILGEEDWEAWLDPARVVKELRPLLRTWEDLEEIAPEPPKKEKPPSPVTLVKQLDFMESLIA